MKNGNKHDWILIGEKHYAHDPSRYTWQCTRCKMVHVIRETDSDPSEYAWMHGSPLPDCDEMMVKNE